MFYQEIVSNGKLYSRTSPTGKWQEVNSPRATALAAFLALSPTDREAVLAYCATPTLQ